MATIKKDDGYNALPISYKRGNPIPLDKSAVWYDKTEMKAYAVSNPTAYVGQVLSYVNEIDNKVEVYVITNEAGDLELLNLADQKADKDSVYTKTEVDTKIGEIIVEGSHLKREILDEVPSEEKPLSSLIDVNGENALNTIYMVKTGLEDDSNKYNEYIVIEKDGKRFIEPVGSWEVSLDNYIIDPKDGSRLLTADESASIGTFQLNFIDSVSSEFTVTTDKRRQLKLNSISIEQVQNLEKLLEDKRNKTDPIMAKEVADLENWIETNGYTFIKNIGVGNLNDALQSKINSSISQVNTAQFDVVDGVLNLKSSNEIGVTLADFNKVVGDLNTLLTNKYNVYEEIESIKSILTWDTINS